MKHLRIIILLALTGLHLFWAVDTGPRYMSDVVTLGRAFFPLLLPYGILAVALSFACRTEIVERVCALALLGAMALCLLLAFSIPVEGDLRRLLTDILRQFNPAQAPAPWLVMGICFHQVIFAVIRRRNYLRRWPLPLFAHLAGYVVLGWIFLSSSLHPGFALRHTLPDALVVFGIRSVLFGMVSILLFQLYEAPVTTFPYRWTRAGSSPRTDDP